MPEQAVQIEGTTPGGGLRRNAPRLEHLPIFSVLMVNRGGMVHSQAQNE
ncbi:hypothetical protein EV13_2916 [Prochlorococcus sp. MIT 0702]|nr:hypothetical protein EV12_2862 [Prochlorococcus sp. MIT 0701]KGG26136.1 hypothetical protein EV13_2916 [Prochlorococcus sp. MIT 0702]KGG32960.1 hypothetical protein EV14_1800 [Prochlorococcus sp. MIT 0703]